MIVSEQELKQHLKENYFYTVHHSEHFKGISRFVKDGKIIGYRDKENNIFEIRE